MEAVRTEAARTEGRSIRSIDRIRGVVEAARVALPLVRTAIRLGMYIMVIQQDIWEGRKGSTLLLGFILCCPRQILLCMRLRLMVVWPGISSQFRTRFMMTPGCVLRGATINFERDE